MRDLRGSVQWTHGRPYRVIPHPQGWIWGNGRPYGRPLLHSFSKDSCPGLASQTYPTP